MNHKIFTPLIFLFISFGVHSNEQIIAYNHDKSIVLTKESLQDWLAYNKQAKYRDLDFQIDAYFLEKALLKKQDKIPNNKLNRINFDHNRYVYNQSFPLYKKEIESKIQINQNQHIKLQEMQKYYQKL